MQGNDVGVRAATRSLLAKPKNGRVTLNATAFTYTPNDGFVGEDHSIID